MKRIRLILVMVMFMIGLCEHETASRRLVQIGALKVLQNLRQNAPEALQKPIQDLLRSIFSNTSEEDIARHHSRDPHQQSHREAYAFQSHPQPSQSQIPTHPRLSTHKRSYSRRGRTNHQHQQRASCWRFPLVSLIRADERYLFDLALRLKVNDAVMVENSLHELRRCAIRDYPAPVFLQRPQILLVWSYTYISRSNAFVSFPFANLVSSIEPS